MGSSLFAVPAIQNLQNGTSAMKSHTKLIIQNVFIEKYAEKLLVSIPDRR